ncbi:hypothetical protein ACFWAR_24480 [Streptomyces sp. NPDC059917]|uniref:hypothetical protein n=1 Tax=Streptomyces sp. NPDC059917 TaxID=3347002 RepID=UPI0036576501
MTTEHSGPTDNTEPVEAAASTELADVAARPGGAPRRRPRWAVASVAAAVLLAGGGTAYWAATAHGGTGAAAASLSAGDAAARAASPGAPGSVGPSAPGIAPGEPNPNGSGVTYRAEGPLPQGPAAAPSFAAGGEVTEAEVARLASALGITAAPRLVGELWQAGVVGDPSGPRLQVNLKAPGTWTFTRHLAGGSDDCRRGKDTCGPATLPGGGAQAPSGGQGPGPAAVAGSDAGASTVAGAGKPVSEEAAKAAAAPLLAAAGQQGAKLDARQLQGSVRVVTADPVVGGLPTQGWQSTVSVGADGQVVAAGGELKAPVKSGEQQVVGAQEALDRLNAASAPGPGTGPSGCATSVPLEPVAPIAPGETPPCNPEPRPMKPPRTETVRTAVLGLAAGTVDGARGLVPAWLFEVAGTGGGAGRTVAQPAARDAAPAPRPGRTVPGFSYSAADRKLTVNFWGGACSAYAAEARESADAVTVKITDTPTNPGGACIMLAKDMSVSVTLEQPLGARKVVDGTTGKELPRQ